MKQLFPVLVLFFLAYISQVSAQEIDVNSPDYLEAKSVEMRIEKEIESKGVWIKGISFYSESVWKIASQLLQNKGYQVKRMSNYYVVEKK